MFRRQKNKNRNIIKFVGDEQMIINKLLTQVNYTKCSYRRDIKYIVIHYVGGLGGAKNNCVYFQNAYRGSSAHYFIGHAKENAEIWQCVEDENIAWHCGLTTGKYKHPYCRNKNSIGIELCCHKDEDGNWYFDKETENAALALVRAKMREYNIPIENVILHYNVTGKRCPEPYVANNDLWVRFKEALMKEFTNANDAFNYLVERGRLSDKDYWLKTLDVVRQQEWVFIKWANDLAKLVE